MEVEWTVKKLADIFMMREHVQLLWYRNLAYSNTFFGETTDVIGLILAELCFYHEIAFFNKFDMRDRFYMM